MWRKLAAGRTLPLRPLPLKVVYHTPCHMEKMGWSLYTLELLRLIPGLQLDGAGFPVLRHRRHLRV